MWNWRELEVSAGLLTRVEESDALGPAPPDPAHAAQLTHPLIFSILDFVVCAEAGRLSAPASARIAITTQGLLWLFNIYSLSRGNLV